MSSSYRLTAQLAAQHGGQILCLAEQALGRRYPLFEARPGPELNEPDFGDLPQEGTDETAPLQNETGGAGLTIVRIEGPLEQRAGAHGPCGGYADGHDAVADRLCAALETGDVLLLVDSPGGAHAGLQESIRRVQKVKARHDRYVTAYVSEMCASAAYWWTACIADAIYAPEAGLIGSIGARSAHISNAEELKKAGRKVTYFYAPGPGKVAFAPELPLSEEGRARGERDTLMAYDAFARDVGKARGLARKDLDKLDADCLPAPLALKAKLIDDVVSFDDVRQEALARLNAQSSENSATHRARKERNVS